ncbi:MULTISPECIES: type III secretion system outer membrane ring subunit SctC [Candidatus Ichthyocystis]|uniref:Type III secretion pore protein C n=1 Tax=Candidatus Ichthyocystis hellenicum TaxID=1561003 RepID=A0A0S4M2E7_9BURK|nr:MULTISPECIES: type III secretion system outer membrane ring subunit SctC [Ichthyocystis]CUT17058.1 type III secretion pore protein C [Candidatus Ichthyocystis hellenicum]
MSVFSKRLFVIAVIGIFGSFHSFAGRVTWPMDSYSYYANNSSLKQVCEDFAAGFGLSVRITPKLHGVLSGRLSTSSPTAFLNRLSSMYGLTWFVDSGILYINLAEESSSRSVRVPSGTAPQIYQALMSLGVLDPRFGWGILSDQNIVMVSGPPPYLDLVERTIKALPIVAGGMQIAVFKVKNASVVDRTIYYRDHQITSPGLATILQQLLTNARDEKLSVAQSPEVRRDAQQLRDAISNANHGVSSDKSPSSGASKGRRPGASKTDMVHPKSYSGPSIQADPRTNSLVISDLPERIPMYQKLIKELDIPISLIQIQVTIIDLNTTHDRELGVNWSAGYDNAAVSRGLLPGGISESDIGLAFAPKGASVNPTTLVMQSARYFLAKVRMLEGKGDATVQSRPSILTTENTGAVLDYSDTFYIQTTGERVASVTPETVGTALRVTPHLIQDGSQTGIKLTIDIQNGSILDKKIGSYPVIRNSTVSTEAIVHEHESLLIGGFYYDFNETGSEGVPFLRNLPIIGHLFTHSHRNVQRRERIFLIQPTVLDPSRVMNQPGAQSRDEVVPAEDVMLPDKLKKQVMSSRKSFSVESLDTPKKELDQDKKEAMVPQRGHVFSSRKRSSKKPEHKVLTHFKRYHSAGDYSHKDWFDERASNDHRRTWSKSPEVSSDRSYNLENIEDKQHNDLMLSEKNHDDKSYDHVLSFLRAHGDGHVKDDCPGCGNVPPPAQSDKLSTDNDLPVVKHMLVVHPDINTEKEVTAKSSKSDVDHSYDYELSSSENCEASEHQVVDAEKDYGNNHKVFANPILNL